MEKTLVNLTDIDMAVLSFVGDLIRVGYLTSDNFVSFSGELGLYQPLFDYWHGLSGGVALSGDSWITFDGGYTGYIPAGI